MKVCLCTISYREKLLEVALAAAQRLQFTAVELWGREPHVPEEYDESRIRGIRAAAEERGLKLPVFGSYLYFGKTQHKDDNVTLVDTLHNAHGLRTPIVRVWASDVGSAGATPDVWKHTIEEAREACDRAAKMNVTFAAEMHDGTLADTGFSARRLVEEIDRSNFRLNFQVGNYDQEDQMQRLEEVLPYVVHMHCQNFVKGDGDTQYKRVQIADGFVDYPSLLGRLKDNGYDGHVAVEFAAEEGENKEQSLRKDLEYLSAC